MHIPPYHLRPLLSSRPIFTGFFFKIWDQLFNTGYPEGCQCHLCRPARSRQMWEETVKPDYSVLLSPKWWLHSSTVDAEKEKEKAKAH